MFDSVISVTIDFAAAGKQFGYLRIPNSTNESGWGNLFVPVVCIANGSGMSALILGGNHGDELEGQIAILKLAAELQPENISGRLILIPCLSVEAVRAGSRLWPSGVNFNRSFPGSPTGPPNEQLADFLTRGLFPLCDVICDIHSGGRSLLFTPMSHMHLISDAEQRRAMMDGMLAWNTDYHMIYIDVAGGGLLATEAERQGKIVVSTELGGGGGATAAIHQLAEGGLKNVLRHFRILAGDVETRKSMGLPESVILRATEAENYVFAQQSGIYETLVDPGEEVKRGQSLGRIYCLERPDRPPEVVSSPANGIVCAIRPLPNTQQGDCVAVVGKVCSRSDLE